MMLEQYQYNPKMPRNSKLETCKISEEDATTLLESVEIDRARRPRHWHSLHCIITTLADGRPLRATLWTDIPHFDVMWTAQWGKSVPQENEDILVVAMSDTIDLIRGISISLDRPRRLYSTRYNTAFLFGVDFYGWIRNTLQAALTSFVDLHLLSLHAAAVETEMGAVILVGSSGSGKSSLARLIATLDPEIQNSAKRYILEDDWSLIDLSGRPLYIPTEQIRSQYKGNDIEVSYPRQLEKYWGECFHEYPENGRIGENSRLLANPQAFSDEYHRRTPLEISAVILMVPFEQKKGLTKRINTDESMELFVFGGGGIGSTPFFSRAIFDGDGRSSERLSTQFNQLAVKVPCFVFYTSPSKPITKSSVEILLARCHESSNCSHPEMPRIKNLNSPTTNTTYEKLASDSTDFNTHARGIQKS